MSEALHGKKHGRISKRPDDKKLLDMYEIMTAREIGEKLGVAESTVRSWIANLRKEYKQNAENKQ